MKVEDFVAYLQRELPRIGTLQLNSDTVQVTYVPNRGGFVNHSFSVRADSTRYHLKLAHHPDCTRNLEKWWHVRDILRSRYRAPRLLEWLNLPEIGFAGLVMEHLEAAAANLRENPAIVPQLIELADRLHRDVEVRSKLASMKTYLDSFIQTYVDRFTADLDTVEAQPPEFMSSTLLRWMRDEIARLSQTARANAAFHQAAIEAIHGDLNETNVLVTSDAWFVLDWDDLSIGDPAIDYAVLLWPLLWKGLNWREFHIPGLTDSFAARMDLCVRAQLLDEVVDTLADYVESSTVPSEEARVRIMKRKRHEEALQRYRSDSKLQ